MLRLTAVARDALRSHEVLVVDWHRVALCCATAGETSLRAVPRARLAGAGGRQLRPADCDPPGAVLVHKRAYPHLAGWDVVVDCRTRFGVRLFVTDLPPDFGLRASLGRLPAPARTGAGPPPGAHPPPEAGPPPGAYPPPAPQSPPAAQSPRAAQSPPGEHAPTGHPPTGGDA